MKRHFQPRAAAPQEGAGSGPLDACTVPFAELSRLDDDALSGALAWVLRPCGGGVGRVWSNDEFRPEP